MKRIQLTLLFLLTVTFSFGQAQRNIVIEEFTGDWCGYCPDGLTILEGIETANPGRIVALGMHSGDQWDFAYTTFMDGALDVLGYPRAGVDRVNYSGGNAFVMSRGYWAGAVAARINQTASCNVGIISSYNSTTRVANITVNANFVGAETGDLRITCLLTENNISSSQTNYMNTDQSSPWYNMGDPIPNYMQKNVVRACLSADNFGDAGIIPASVTAGNSYSKSYSFTIPSTWNASNVKIAAFVNKYGETSGTIDLTKIPIINGAETELGTSVAVENVSEISATTVSTQPNPFSEFSFINVSVAQTAPVKIVVTDILGREVNVICNETITAGAHQFVWAGTDNQFNELASGTYLVNVYSGDAVNTVKVVKQ